MEWYSKLIKTADIGHGNTLDGQMLLQHRTKLLKEISELRTVAATGGPNNVLPRWRGELRQQIFKLPAVARLDHMSMFEIKQVEADVEAIKQSMAHYSVSRFKEIVNASDSGERGAK